MSSSLIYILLVYGFTNILVYGSIFEKPRTWLKSKSKWLDDFVNSKLFLSVMDKYPEYKSMQKPLIINFNKLGY